MLRRAQDMAGPGCYSQPVVRKFRGTVSSGVVTAVAGECDAGIAVGDFSTGVSTVTLSPRPKRCSFLHGAVYNGNVAVGDIHLLLGRTAYDSAAGTLTMVSVNMAATPAIETPEDADTIEFFLLLDEGSA